MRSENLFAIETDNYVWKSCNREKFVIATAEGDSYHRGLSNIVSDTREITPLSSSQ